MNVVDIYGIYSSNSSAVFTFTYSKFCKFFDKSLGLFQPTNVQQFSLSN